MKKVLIFGILLLAVVIVLGCSGKPAYSTDNTTSEESQTPQQPAAPTQTTVQTLNLVSAVGKNWDADPDVDGIEVSLQPKDRDDNVVQTDGVITAKLWESKYESIESYNKVKGALIQEWTLSINKDNYDVIWADLRLEYKSGFAPTDSMATGWLEVTLTTQDGKSFTARDDTVFLAGI